MRRPGRLAICLAAIASVSSIAATGAAAAAPTPDEENLVRTYAPILELRAQEDPTDPCDPTEEQYNPPTWVEAVLGNPRVKLVHHVDGRDVVVKTAPTASDIAGLNEDYYLDLPGDPLEAGCTYAKDYANLKANSRAPAITYAHIARETGHSGLVVQYFFFYYFNQFNDVHEGDWEGMQIAFDADTPAQALADGPSEIALFQHGGGEWADWDAAKVQKENDTHPIVYPAAGSHATFYDDAIYIENGQNGSGVGCDNSSKPLTRTEPEPVIVPTHAPPGAQFEWLSYLGHWGQREKGFNIGPQGPVTKSQWLEPFTWMDGVRQGSPRLPGGTILGPAASTAFCGAIAGVSEFINLQARTTIGAIGLGVGLLLLILIPPLLTRWRPVDISQLWHRWAVGQLLRGARQIYGRYWRTMLLFALTGFVILGAIQGLSYLFAQINNGSEDSTVGISLGGLDLKLGGSFNGVAEPIGSAIVSGIVVAFMRLLVNDEERGFKHCWRAMYERLWRVVAGQLLAIGLLTLLVITLIGIPFAAYFYIAWQFIQQEIMFENRSIRQAFQGSSRLVRGRWWRALRVVALLALITVVTGPVIGFFLIFLNFSPILVNLIGSAVFALLIPYVAIGRTLLYFDLRVSEEAEEAAGLTRRYWFSRPRPRTA
jgi:hypothetical protein